MERKTLDVSDSGHRTSFYQKIGKVHCFSFNNEGTPRITIGPNCNPHTGPIFLITLLSLLSIALFFLFYICPQVGTINILIGVLIFLSEILLYIATALINQGIVVPNVQMKSTGDFNFSLEKICLDCNLTKSDETEHCKKCRVCVEEFDHHYILIGKCVGKHTIKYFYGLIISSLLLLIFAITTLFFRYQKNFS